MSKGPHYSEEELKRLQQLMKDHPDKNVGELAQMALDYGISNRSITGLVQRFVKFQQELSYDSDEREDQITFDDLEIDIYKRAAAMWQERYESLRSAILDTASLYKGEIFNSLHLDFRAIMKWLRENDPESLSARLEELESEEKQWTKRQ